MNPEPPAGGPGPGNDPDQPADGPDPRRLRPTQPGPLAALVVLGMVLGWALRPLWQVLGDASPSVGWPQVGVLTFVAAAVAAAAVATRRALAPGAVGLPAHRGVNRLVMARACAQAGALLLGGYVGHAVSWLGVPSEPAAGHLLRALAAALASGAIVCGALALERACRTGSGPDQP